jgi:AcrR family transcriptional regulator
VVAYGAEVPVSRATPSGCIQSWSSSAWWPGGLFDILGIDFVTLALAVLRVLHDFFRVRLKTDEVAVRSTTRRSARSVDILRSQSYSSAMDNNSVIYDDGVTKPAAVTDYRRDRERGRKALRLGILDAAGRLLVEEGPEALSMRRVAREVNASTQVLYTMFGGKDGLANELFLEGFVRLTRAHGARPRSDDPLRHLYDRAETYFENALANPNYYRVMFFDAIPGFRPSEETLAKTWGTFDALSEAVRACARAGLFAREVEEEPREAALSLWSAAHGVVSLYLVGHLPDEAEARRVFERTMRGVVGGLLVRNQDA